MTPDGDAFAAARRAIFEDIDALAARLNSKAEARDVAVPGLNRPRRDHVSMLRLSI